MDIKQGGQTDSIKKDDKIKSIRVQGEPSMLIQLWVNDSSMSYLHINEAIELRDELNMAIRQAAGL